MSACSPEEIHALLAAAPRALRDIHGTIRVGLGIREVL